MRLIMRRRKGWDKIREEWFELQKALGIVQQDATLPPRSPYVRAWDDLSADEVAPVVPDYEVPFRFSRELKKVTYLLSTPDLDAKSMVDMELASE
ncbi:hypothetical protein [Paenibacillus sp.]|uniref:hypothetical protein n=1 Tax=Paenibacillus sp. TaxID=58172 RepID=UPI002D558941|nr:hypothetical protein [Paenibacillus sp.]HZG84030.1 hypothetical protein [Paenibacillus sp.]